MAVLLARSASALTINLTFDPDANFTTAGLNTTDIANMKAACTYAANQFTSRYSDPINVNIKVTASPGTSDFGSSIAFFIPVDTYNNLRASFAADSKTGDDATTVGAGGSLPAGADPIATAHQYNVTRAQAKALGYRPDDMQNDGTFNFGGGHPWTYDPNNRNVTGKFDFIGVAMHEYSEIMGRTSSMGDTLGTGTPNYVAFDLFHYTGAGTRGLSNGAGRSFSFDNGTTLLIAFNNNAANGGDLQDWAGPAPDSFNAAGPPGEQDDMTPVDLQTMDVIGYDRSATVPGVVANVSTRLPVGTGDNVLIEGFIVQGPAGSIKKILVRGIGPSLVPFGITDALANPTLGIFDSNNAQIASNDNWKTTQVGGIITGDQFAEINGSGLAPTNDAESAIIANLAPGSYTAVVRGAGNTVGTGVVDAFDLSTASTARLANVATRGLVQPGDKLLIGAFIIQNGSVRVVVRAIGPSLAGFGVTNALPDTTLELRNQNGGLVRANDDWKTDQKAELEATGLNPTNDLEAALVDMIQPGQYSALVRGKPEATGTGVVQIYFLQ
ncbi:MAG: NF038122 family metalloprotease [Chthoniobacterales bacterium]